MDVINPATEAVIATVEDTSDSAIGNAFRAAKSAQAAWAARPFAERREAIDRFRNLLAEAKERLAILQTEETGKPISQARGEIGATDGRIQFFLQHTETRLKTRPVRRDEGSRTDEEISWEPLGVVANISAWNYPYFVGTNVFIPALLTGNAVLYKPSEFCPRTGAAIGELMHEAGVPQDVFAVIQGGADAGKALCQLDIDGLYFTGSFQTGRKIAQSVAGRMMRVQMELGGKDPVYVAADADVVKAAPAIADGAFYNAGQSCCAVERIYVHRAQYDAFVDEFVKAVADMRVGDPLKEETYLGPLCRKAQLDVLEEQVRDALTKGGKLLLGGKRKLGQGYFFEPTVIANAGQDMLVMQEESFGPIIGIAAVESEAQALQFMADTPYGLTAGVFSKDVAVAKRVLAGLRVGSAYWNCGDRVSPYLPWTGRGHSGIGSTLSEVGIDAFLIPKSWHLRPES